MSKEQDRRVQAVHDKINLMIPAMRKLEDKFGVSVGFSVDYDTCDVHLNSGPSVFVSGDEIEKDPKAFMKAFMCKYGYLL